MAAQRPSQLLGSPAITYNPKIYEMIVEKHVIPFLDCLPTKEKTALMTILTKVQDYYLGSGLVAFDTYTASIASKMEELESHIRMDRREGWETQVRIPFSSTHTHHTNALVVQGEMM